MLKIEIEIPDTTKDVQKGTAIYTHIKAIKDLGGRVHARITGDTVGLTSFIALAADTVHMDKTAIQAHKFKTPKKK